MVTIMILEQFPVPESFQSTFCTTDLAKGTAKIPNICSPTLLKAMHKKKLVYNTIYVYFHIHQVQR